jgi:hypothetical protein
MLQLTGAAWHASVVSSVSLINPLLKLKYFENEGRY